tara:strand:- start:5215 stop:5997 length:783 start_codon:yes stop_codon:yes gene_type:complete
MDIEKHFDTKATYKGYEKITGRRRRNNIPYQYLDNVMKIGDEVIDNRSKTIFRENLQVQLSDHFEKESSIKHAISYKEAVLAVVKGIKVRSDTKGQERYSYLHDGNLAATREIRDGLLEIVTAYRIQRAYKRNFVEHLGDLKKEIMATGAIRFDVQIVDTTLLAMQAALNGGKVDFDAAVVWRTGDDHLSVDPSRGYAMFIIMDDKEGFRREQKKILVNWGLGEIDTLHLIEHNDGDRNVLVYNMGKFSGNFHQWARKTD